ncbi:MAG TPA: hypothetical protein VFI41_00765 [Gemmatimonadales bacterium]|jgi:hypothetical protein|nr:hypothetical protein [Gemmatimonadales bacterium]
MDERLMALAIGLACTACSQPLLHPAPWQPFLTAPGAALGRVWTDPTPPRRAELWVNVPASEPFSDSLLIRDFQRWTPDVHLSRDSAAGTRPPGKYYLRLDIRRTRTCPLKSDRCEASLRAAPTTVAYAVTSESCAAWPCHAGQVVTVRDSVGVWLPADDVVSWTE